MSDLTKNEKILIEEIKIIQDIIKRMADNSFKIKAWAITLVVATLLIKSNVNNSFIAFIPLITFWFLDAYYLQQEKIFRKVYDDKVENKTTNDSTMFIINPNSFKKDVSSIFFIMFWNKSITPLYVTILTLLVLLSVKINIEVIQCITKCVGA
ncbi:MAG TPA: hypothetical protein EYP87_00770 [Flavobacteriaceae bacterium]|nr:hypothetical protein [Flavobacteriaceae bacterium]